MIYMQRANDVSKYLSPDPRTLILIFKQTKSPKALLYTQYSSLQLQLSNSLTKILFTQTYNWITKVCIF